MTSCRNSCASDGLNSAGEDEGPPASRVIGEAPKPMVGVGGPETLAPFSSTSDGYLAAGSRPMAIGCNEWSDAARGTLQATQQRLPSPSCLRSRAVMRRIESTKSVRAFNVGVAAQRPASLPVIELRQRAQTASGTVEPDRQLITNKRNVVAEEIEGEF